MDHRVSALVVNSIDKARRKGADGSAARPNVTRSYEYYWGVIDNMYRDRYEVWWGLLCVGEGIGFLFRGVDISWIVSVCSVLPHRHRTGSSGDLLMALWIARFDAYYLLW